MKNKGNGKRVREVVFNDNDNQTVESYRSKKSKQSLSEVLICEFP